MTFLEWLRAQAKADANGEQAFAALYEYGPYFTKALGEMPPNPVAFAAHLKLEEIDQPKQDELLRQLVIADATWRTDEFSGEDLPLPAGEAPGKGLTIKPSKCGFRDLDGLPCRAYAVDGAARCRDHGGAITDPAVRGSLLLLAYAQLTQGTKKAVDTLLDVMETSTNDLARVNAAKEMLDRAGLSIDQHHTVTMDSRTTDTRADALERIKAVLDSTRDRLLPAVTESDDEIVDAELVEPDLTAAS